MTEHALVQWLRQNNHFLILTHVRPDGDTLGCASALCLALNKLGKTAYLLRNPGDLQKFKGFLTFLWAPDDYMPDHVIAVDIATENLLPQGAHQAYRGRVEVCVDHHASNDGYARELCLDTGASACGESLFRVCRQLGVLDEQIAKALYIAIATDCGGFIYSNTTSETHRIAAALMEYGDFRKLNKHFFQTKSFKQLRLESMVLGSEEFYADGQVCIGKISLADKASVGADEGDCEELASFAASIEGVGCAATLRELTPGEWKVSLRSVDTYADSNRICARLGGGGHAAAAGATVLGTEESVRRQVCDAIFQELKR